MDNWVKILIVIMFAIFLYLYSTNDRYFFIEGGYVLDKRSGTFYVYQEETTSFLKVSFVNGTRKSVKLRDIK